MAQPVGSSTTPIPGFSRTPTLIPTGGEQSTSVSRPELHEGKVHLKEDAKKITKVFEGYVNTDDYTGEGKSVGEVELGTPPVDPNLSPSIVAQFGAVYLYGSSRFNVGISGVSTTDRKILPGNVVTLRASLPMFIERKGSFQELEKTLLPKEGYTERTQEFLLWGSSGVGKSELACYFANHYKTEFSIVGWLDCESLSYRDLSIALCINERGKLSPDELSAEVIFLLENYPFEKPWLLVCDNIVQKFPRPQRGGSILYTSIENINWLELEENQKRQMHPFSFEEALAFVKSRTTETDEASMQLLIQELNALPLALVVAMAYIEQTKQVEPSYTISIYWKDIRKAKGFLSRPEAQQGSVRHPKSLLQTWELTLNRLERLPVALEWLNLCAYLDPAHIPRDWLRHWLSTRTDVDLDQIEDKVRDILLFLMTYAVIQYDAKKESISLHHLTQQILQLSQKNPFSCYQAAVRLLIDQGKDFHWRLLDMRRRSSEWKPHGHQIINHTKLFARLTDAEKGKLYLVDGKVMYEFNDHISALNRSQAALTAFRAAPQKNNSDIATALNAVAENLFIMHRYPDALLIFEEALRFRELECENPKDLAESYCNLGAVLFVLHQIPLASQCAKKGYDMLNEIYDEDDPGRARSLTIYGVAIASSKSIKEGLVYLKKALEMWQRLYPDQDHPEVARSFNNVAISWQFLGLNDDALEYSQKALDMQRRLYPSQNHADIASSLLVLGEILHAMNKYKEAAGFKQQALEMWQKLYPDQNHPEVAGSLESFGITLQEIGEDYNQAYQLLKDALEMRRNFYQEQANPDTLSSLNSFSAILRKLNREDEARILEQQAKEMLKQIDERPDIAETAKQTMRMQYISAIRRSG